jgi:tetratricopeptide (TPR) repeat protein
MRRDIVEQSVFRGRGAVWLVAVSLFALACEKPVTTAAVAIPKIDLDGVDPVVARAARVALAGVEREPGSAASWGELGMVLLAHERFSAAITALERAEQLDSVDPRWPYFQGLAWREGEPAPDRVRAAFERATARCGSETAPWAELGDLCWEIGEIDRAEAAYSEVIARSPEEPRARLGLGRIAWARGDVERALAELRRSAASAPDVRATQALLSQVLFRRGENEAARDAALRAARLPATHYWPDPFRRQILDRWVGALAAVERAGNLFDRGDAAGALLLLEAAARENPRALLVHLMSGRLLLRLGRATEARAALEKAVEIAPDSFEAHHELGLALDRASLPRESAAAFRRALELEPSFAPSHFRLAHALERLGDRKGSLASLEAAVRFKPDYAPARRDLAHLLGLEERYPEALAHARRAAELEPDDAKTAELIDILERARNR